MKTSNLKSYNDQMKKVKDTGDTIIKSKHDIKQFNEIKCVLINFSFINEGKKTLCVDIIESVMDELRRDRKIRMVLNDAEIEEYIKLDLSTAVDDEDASPFLKKILFEKK